MKKVLFIASLSLLLAALSLGLIAVHFHSDLSNHTSSGNLSSDIITPCAQTGPHAEPAPSEQAESEPPPEPVVTEITLSFVGDCMLASDRGAEYAGTFNALANSVDPAYFFENFLELFENDDWTVANLENVFTDDPEVQARAKNYTPAYWYKSKTANTAILTAGSVEVVSLANNHSEDYGKTGYADTRDALDRADVRWGDNDTVVLLEKDGYTIALYCTTFYYSGYDRIIAKKLAETEADYKIVYFHGGTERVHVPDAWKAAGSRRLIDDGIDLVIGGHPHVLQPIETYQGKTIVHSLGNFIFGGSRNEENRTIVYRLYLTVTDGVLTAVTDEVIPCYVYSDDFKPAIITDEAEIKAVRDFLYNGTESPMDR